MKKLLLLCILAHAISAHAQLADKEFNVYGRYSFGSYDTTSYNNFGLTGEWLVHRKVGLLYNFDLTYRSDNYRHLHAPMGLIGGPILFVAGLANLVDGDTTSTAGLSLVGIVMLVLPDGVSYHQPIGYRWDVSPYANLLGIDFIKDQTYGNRLLKYACSFGVRGTYVLKDQFTFSPYIETRKTASVPWGFGAGIGVGILFGERETKIEEQID
jgi:opacity protein-like surface antigen